jgi:alkaline phosphatase
LGQENNKRLLLKEGAITSIPRSLCGNPGAKNVILVIGDGMGWEMTRAGSIAKQVVAELKGYGCDIVNGCPSNTAASAAFAGRMLDSYYTEGK